VLLAAIWLPWAVRRRGDIRRRWRAVIAPHLLNALVVGETRKRALRPVHLSALLLALGAVALAGPTWERERPPFPSDKAPLVIAVDLSPTMDAIDVTPTRLERAKLKIKALLARRDGGRTALYAYAGSTHLVLPLTDDPTLLQTFADALQTRIMPVPGKDTVLAVRTIDAALKKETVPGTILLLTDGVEPAAVEPLHAYARSARTQVVVLAIGTVDGGPLRGRDGTAPGLDSATLHALRAADIDVATLTPDGDADVAWVQRHVRQHVEQAASPDTVRWHDVGWPLTIPIALLALLWFRKGWTIRWIVGIGAAMVLDAPQADGRNPPPPREHGAWPIFGSRTTSRGGGHSNRASSRRPRRNSTIRCGAACRGTAQANLPRPRASSSTSAVRTGISIWVTRWRSRASIRTPSRSTGWYCSSGPAGRQRSATWR